MLKIRLSRLESRKRINASRIVVVDSRKKRSNHGKENLGFYQPQSSTYLSIDLLRVEYWIARGAQCTERVRKLVDIARKNSQYVRN